MVRYARPEFAAVDKTALAQNRLAAGIYLTSMGLPFWQAGEEFARTKKGQGNSYRSSPALNRLDWHRAEQFHSLVDYYRGSPGWARWIRPALPPSSSSRWNSLLWAGGSPPSGATARHGAPCASTITPPRRRRSSPCPAAAGSC